MIRVKICGLTTPEDASAAAGAGADLIGLNFVGGPRRVDPQQAATILDSIPPASRPVALVDIGAGRIPEDVEEVLARHQVRHLQLYGKVTPEALTRLAEAGYHAILVHQAAGNEFVEKANATLAALAPACPEALLVDAHRKGMQGGTGEVFDWDALAAAQATGETRSWPPLILAGGLNPDNVARAVATVRPWAVDVSSGVESAPGCKCESLMRSFVERARAAAD